MRVLIALFISASLCLTVAACSKSKTEESSTVAVAALVNGDTITVADAERVAEGFIANGGPPDPEAEGSSFAEKMYYTAVNRLVEQQLVMNAARELGLEVTDEDVTRSLSQLIAMSGGEAAFEGILAQRGITMDDVRRDMRINLTLQRYFEEVVNKNSPVTPDDVQAYYDAHPEEFGPQPEVHARHILIRTTSDMTPAARAAAKDTAETVQKRAASGEDFAALALEYSEDPTNAQTGGDLGWFRKGQMVPPFDSAAFALKPGQISGVVTTSYGYHIIDKEGERTGEAMDLSDPQVQQMIQNDIAGERFRAAVADLREQADVVVNPPTPEVLDKISA